MRLAADNWCVKTNDRVYGPYTSAQLRKFAHEGRLAAWSLIAPAGSRAWREAREEKSFASFFGAANGAKGPETSRSFGKLDEARETDADTFVEGKTTSAASTIKSGQAKKTAKPAMAASGPANFIIIFDVINAAASRVEAAMVSLGAAFLIAENVWTVSCELTAVGVRNAISPYLRPSESIFVVDATNGRSSWQNYAPELQAKISAAWQNVKN